MTTRELELRCDQAKHRLHKFIDLIADREFFYVDMWHIFRATGCLLWREDRDRDYINAIMNHPIGTWDYEIEKAKWQESIKMMQHEI